MTAHPPQESGYRPAVRGACSGDMPIVTRVAAGEWSTTTGVLRPRATMIAGLPDKSGRRRISTLALRCVMSTQAIRIVFPHRLTGKGQSKERVFCCQGFRCAGDPRLHPVVRQRDSDQARQRLDYLHDPHARRQSDRGVRCHGTRLERARYEHPTCGWTNWTVDRTVFEMWMALQLPGSLTR